MVRNRSLKAWLILTALVLVGGLTVVHAALAVRHYVYFEIHRDEPIQPWMTIQFVAHSYHVSAPMLQSALGLPVLPPDRRPLSRISTARRTTFAAVKATLERSIVRERSHPGWEHRH